MCLLLRSLWPQFAVVQVLLVALTWVVLEEEDCDPQATEASGNNATAIPTSGSNVTAVGGDSVSTDSPSCGDYTKLGASLIVLEVLMAITLFGFARRMSRLRAVGVDEGVAQGGGAVTLLSRPQWRQEVSTAIQRVAGLVLVEQPDGTLAVGKTLDHGAATNAVQIEWQRMLPDGESLAAARQRWRRRRLPYPLLSARITQEGTTIATVAPWHPPRASRANPNASANSSRGNDGDGGAAAGAVVFVDWDQLPAGADWNARAAPNTEEAWAWATEADARYVASYAPDPGSEPGSWSGGQRQ